MDLGAVERYQQKENKQTKQGYVTSVMFNPGNSNKGAGGESKEALLRQAEEARQQRLVEKKKV